MSFKLKEIINLYCVFMGYLKELITRKISRDNIEPFLSRHQSKELTLDIGGGYSPYVKYFPNRTVFDINDWDGVDIVGDAHDIPVKDGEYARVLCTYVLNALHSPEIAVREMHRVLAPGGLVILTSNFMFPMHGTPYDYYRFSKYGLINLFESAGFEIVELKGESTQRSLAIFLQRIAIQCDFRGGKFTRGILYLIAKLLTIIPNMIKEEYGNALRTNKDNEIASAMYYLVAKKVPLNNPATESGSA